MEDEKEVRNSSLCSIVNKSFVWRVGQTTAAILQRKEREIGNFLSSFFRLYNFFLFFPSLRLPCQFHSRPSSFPTPASSPVAMARSIALFFPRCYCDSEGLPTTLRFCPLYCTHKRKKIEISFSSLLFFSQVHFPSSLFLCARERQGRDPIPFARAAPSRVVLPWLLPSLPLRKIGG